VNNLDKAIEAYKEQQNIIRRDKVRATAYQRLRVYEIPLKIIALVEMEYNLPEGSVLKPQRTKTYSEARAVAMYLCRVYTKFSYVELAQVFNRHHTSVIHNVQRVGLAIEDDLKETN